VGRFRRILRRIVEIWQSGVFVQERGKHVVRLSEEIARIRGGQTIVVDIAKLTNDEQALVFGDILRTVCALYAEAGIDEEEIPEKVIIFVDELNKYAPARERESPIIEQVLDIAFPWRDPDWRPAVHERGARPRSRKCGHDRCGPQRRSGAVRRRVPVPRPEHQGQPHTVEQGRAASEPCYIRCTNISLSASPRANRLSP